MHSEAFWVVSQLAEKLGVIPLNQHEGCWEHQVDEHWSIKINAHETEIDGIPPFHCYVQFNGWPAGMFSPFGGVIAAGDAANEDTFIEAVKEAIKRAPSSDNE